MSTGPGTELAYVTAFSAPHRADIGDFAASIMEGLIDQVCPEGEAIPREQAVALARVAADSALPQLLRFVGSGELDLYVGDGEDRVRFTVDPDRSSVTNPDSEWAWINDEKEIKE